MEDGKVYDAGIARVSPAPAEGPMESACVSVQKDVAATAQRQRFAVELRPGETTIVSWKRLLREPRRGGGAPAAPSGADPVFGGHVGHGAAVQSAEGKLKDVPPSNRFSAVIEKIERLYMGNQSSDDEELDDIPDDDEYDTEDSFIDDAELDEYFQVDKSTTKYSGFFVNKGKLERVEPSSYLNMAPKKRRRKDSARSHTEKDGDHMAREHNIRNARINAASSSASLMGKKLSSPSKVSTHFDDPHEEAKHLKDKVDIPTISYKKKSSDVTTSSENPLYPKAPHKDVPSPPLESKDVDKRKAGLIASRDMTYKSRGTGEASDATYAAPTDKAVPSQVESQSRKLSNGEGDIEASTKIRHKERNGPAEFPDLNASASIYPRQSLVTPPSSVRVKEGAAVRPKGTTLERAIRDLEKIVALCRPPDLDFQEMDASSQGIKRRLPQEVKQKLAKVARLSASQCKISEDHLIDRLMGILGHLVQRKTLKRNMKEMVELGLSAKQQKADRFQQIKKEVNEMIRARASLLTSKVAEQLNGSTDDFQEASVNDEKRALKGKFTMDKALEDKICDLYDLYVEGMDEDKGPQSRKLYAELAELWPSGYMDNVSIKQAIYRSKERKRAMYNRHKSRDEERIKRKRLAAAMRVDGSSLSAQVRAGQERPALDYSGQFHTSSDRQATSQTIASSGRIVDSIQPTNDFGHHIGSKHHERKRGSTSTGTDDGIEHVKKKIKRRSESDSRETYAHPLKLPHQEDKERNKSHKQSDDTNASNFHRAPISLPGIPGSEQPS